MQTIFDELDDSHATYYSPTEQSAVDKITVLFKGRESHFKTIYIE
jgi:hypothetical protein